MRPRLTPQVRRFFDLLSAKSPGDLLSEHEILAETGWKPITLSTYRRKNHLDSLLALEQDGRYRVLKDGHSLSIGEIAAALTQVRPEILALTRGLTIAGNHSTYELTALVGRGAIAQVWRCVEKLSGTDRAAKILDPRPDLLAPSRLENVQRRFAREASNGLKLSHPHIVVYRDRGQFSDTPFLIMDLADESLADMMRKGTIPLGRSVEIVLACLKGLEYLHAARCVHRDVKPHNILRFGNHFVLADLGIVRWPDMNPAFTTAGTMTRASLQLGSWHYMAPEQRRSPHEATTASDVYALAITWYEMLTGVVLDPAQAAAQQFEAATPNTSLAEIMKKMLSYNPDHRPTIKDLLSRLATLGADRG